MSGAAAPSATLESAVGELAAAGVDSPRLDAELLLAHALGLTRADLYSRRELEPSPDEAARFDGYVRRRQAREPVAYIVGRRAFRRIELALDARVLIPRPESELLVEVALELPERSRVHDAGTGSGAVALAIKDERPDLVVSASDVSPGAVDVARENARRLGLTVSLSVADLVPDGDFDLVVANLPYVREDEWAGLAPEITRYEPRGALVSGADGLAAIAALVRAAPAGLAVALEHDPAQSSALRRMLSGARTLRDLAGRERVTTGRVR